MSNTSSVTVLCREVGGGGGEGRGGEGRGGEFVHDRVERRVGCRQCACLTALGVASLMGGGPSNIGRRWSRHG